MMATTIMTITITIDARYATTIELITQILSVSFVKEQNLQFQSVSLMAQLQAMGGLKSTWMVAGGPYVIDTGI